VSAVEVNTLVDNSAAGGTAAAADDVFLTGTPLPDIPGLVLRHLRPPDDYAAMNVLANEVRIAQGMDFTTSDEQFQAFYENPPNSDPAKDVVVADLDGRLVGYGRASWHQEPDGPRIYEANLFVGQNLPDGVLTAVLDAMEARLRVIAADDPAGEKLFETFGSEQDAERDRLLRQRGYAPTRYFFSMVRPTMDDLPDAPLPAGLEIREVLPEHLPAIWAADQEAFADHWGFAPATESDYQRFLTDPATSDTTLWRVAWDGDQIAGQVRSYVNAPENERLGRKRGYVEFISVRRPWRRRGLARALIAASFPLLRARGMQEGALGVDAENTSGALRVYENCGFRRVSSSTVYRKPLS